MAGTRRTALTLVVVAAVVLAAVVARLALFPEPSRVPILAELPEFHFVDESGTDYGRADLAGTVFAVNGIFTRCTSLCPRLTDAFARVQGETSALGERFHLVSLSVDPEHDTSEVLRAYGVTHGAIPGRWTFLTGEPSKVRNFITTALKVALIERDDPAEIQALMHDPHAVLVDGQARIRGYYDLTTEAGVTRLVRDATSLVEEE